MGVPQAVGERVEVGKFPNSLTLRCPIGQISVKVKKRERRGFGEVQIWDSDRNRKCEGEG